MLKNSHSFFQSPHYKKYMLFFASLLAVLLFTSFDSYVVKAISFQQPSSENNILEINKSISQELKGEESHSYKVDLMEGQYVKILVEQKGVDVQVNLLAPNGELFVKTDNPYGERGTEVLEAVISSSGSYKIEIVNTNQVTGNYEVQLKELRVASSKDKYLVGERLLAETTLEEGRELYNTKNKEKLLKALETFEKAIKHSQAAENKEIEVDTLNEIGRTYRSLVNTSKAREYYEKVLGIAITLPDPVARKTFESASAINLGDIYYTQGYYQKAFDNFKKALNVYRDLGINHQVAVSASNLANCYMFFGDLTKAKELYEEALSIHQKTGDLNRQIVVLDNLGSLNYYSNNIEEAEKYFQQAIEIQKQDNLRKASTLRNLGSMYSQLGNSEKAVKFLQQSLEMFQKIGNKPEEGLTLVRIGQNFFNSFKEKKESKDNSENIHNALESLNKALPLLKQDSRSVSVTEALGALAEIKFEMGNLKEAQKDIEEAIKLITFTQNSVIDPNLHEVYRDRVQSSYDLYITLLMKQHLTDPTSGYDIKAFQVSEQSRARSFLQLLTESKIDIRQGISQDLIDKELHIKKELDKLQVALIALKDNNPIKLEEIKKQQQVALRDLRELLVEIKKESPSFVALTEVEPLELEKLQKQTLDSESLLLEYFLGKNESYLWIISQTDIKSYTLPANSKDINNLAQEVYKLLSFERNTENRENTATSKKLIKVNQKAPLKEEDKDKAYWQIASKLSQLILPNPEQLQKKRLIIVADGSLHYIPFGALPILSSNKTANKNNLYTPLIETNEIVNLPSASVPAFLRQKDEQQALAQKILIVTDPVFSASDRRLSKKSTKEQPSQSQSSLTEEEIISIVRDGNKFGQLRESLREAKSITDLALDKCKKLSGFQASKNNFLAENLLAYYIIHFVTHGEVNDQTPELSRIVFSLINESGEIQNGFLSLYEIYNLKLQADLVVLSTCQSALGKELKGEGIIGLTRGFMSAGASRVVSSLWNVNDTATAELMISFYKKMLQENKTPSQALRLAQIEMSKRESFKSPYFWAPFTLQGKWN